VSSRGAAAWVAAGLVTVSLGLGGVAVLGLATEEAAPTDDWRPTCSRSLGPGYATIDVRTEEVPPEGRVLLFGIDRSPSNAEQSDAQLDAATQYVGSLPLATSYGVLFVSDRSDRSSTPDLPIEAAQASHRAVADPLPCAPDCSPDTLFERACQGQVEEALAMRADAVTRELAVATSDAVAARGDRLRTWSARAHAYWPEPGTSLLRFWHKVADLPAVRRDPSRVTIVLMSDLEEARTKDRQALRRFDRAFAKGGGECPVDNPIPTELSGARVVLVQTVTDGVDADRWASTWEQVLTCAGVHFERFRYSASIPLADYLGPA
jgi:hypothetical protein